MNPVQPTASDAGNPTLLQHFGRNPPAPTVRFWIWFGIYLAAEVPMIWRGIFCGEGYNFAVTPFLMPTALGMIVVIPLNLLPSAISEAIAGPVIGLGLIAGYLGYALNLFLILRAQSRRRFSALLLIHVTVVLLNQALFWGMAHSISL